MSAADYENVPLGRRISRRRVLQWGALGLASALMPARGYAAVRESLTTEKALSFYNIHTGEDLDVGYYPGPDFIHIDTGRVRYW